MGLDSCDSSHQLGIDSMLFRNAINQAINRFGGWRVQSRHSGVSDAGCCGRSSPLRRDLRYWHK